MPVINDADRKGILEICQELGAISEQGARRQALAGRHAGRRPSRSPRSAASAAPRSRRSSTRRRWRSSASCARRWRRCGTASEFEPRLMLPLSLSYDHRVIDGALAARFTRHLATSWKTCAGSCSERGDDNADRNHCSRHRGLQGRPGHRSACQAGRQVAAEEPLITLESTRRRWTCPRRRPARSRS